MPNKKNINTTETTPDIATIPTEATGNIPAITDTSETPVKKTKKNPSDTKALKKKIAELETKLSEENTKIAQLETMLTQKQADLDKATKIIERLTQEYTRRTRFILNTISQAHQAINIVLEDR